MNQSIEVQDLQVGDEIIVSSNSALKYLKVLRPVKLKKGGKICNWTKKPLYATVYCSFRRVEKQLTVDWGSGNTRTYTRKEYECTPLDHNMQDYQNLNYKTIWLVKR